MACSYPRAARGTPQTGSLPGSSAAVSAPGAQGTDRVMDNKRERDQTVVPSDEVPDDTSGGPLSSGAGEGAGQGGPDVDVPGGAPDSGDATDDAIGGGGM